MKVVIGERSGTGKRALGLPTVAALTPPGWTVAIHEARVTPLDYEQKVDLVGITGYTAEIPSTYAIADEFRKRGIPVVRPSYLPPSGPLTSAAYDVCHLKRETLWGRCPVNGAACPA